MPNSDSMLTDLGLMYYIFIGIWYFFNIAFIILLGIIIWKIIIEDYKKIAHPEEIIPENQNPFDQNSANRIKKKTEDKTVAPYKNIIAIIPGLGLSWVFFVYFAGPASEYILNIGKFRGLTEIGLLLATFSSGYLYGKLIYMQGSKVSESTDEFDYVNTYDQAKTRMVGFLSFSFFALLFALATQAGPELNISKGVSIVFIVGMAFYIAFKVPTPQILGNPIKKYLPFGEKYLSENLHEKLSKLKKGHDE